MGTRSWVQVWVGLLLLAGLLVARHPLVAWDFDSSNFLGVRGWPLGRVWGVHNGWFWRPGYLLVMWGVLRSGLGPCGAQVVMALLWATALLAWVGVGCRLGLTARVAALTAGVTMLRLADNPGLFLPSCASVPWACGFVAVTLLAWGQARASGRWGWYPLAWGSFALALMGKEEATAALPLLLCLEGWSGAPRRSWGWAVPLLVLLGVYGWVWRLAAVGMFVHPIGSAYGSYRSLEAHLSGVAMWRAFWHLQDIAWGGTCSFYPLPWVGQATLLALVWGRSSVVKRAVLAALVCGLPLSILLGRNVVFFGHYACLSVVGSTLALAVLGVELAREEPGWLLAWVAGAIGVWREPDICWQVALSLPLVGWLVKRRQVGFLPLLVKPWLLVLGVPLGWALAGVWSITWLTSGGRVVETILLSACPSVALQVFGVWGDRGWLWGVRSRR